MYWSGDDTLLRVSRKTDNGTEIGNDVLDPKGLGSEAVSGDTSSYNKLANLRIILRRSISSSIHSR